MWSSNLLVASFLLLSLTSCTRKNDGLFEVKGQVKFNGTPAAGANVYFHRHGADTMKDQTVMGIVRDDGKFELVSGSLGPGALPGEYDVMIEWKPVVGQAKGRPQRGRDQLKGRYSDPRRPLLHATIKEQRNELAPFELNDH